MSIWWLIAYGLMIVMIILLIWLLFSVYRSNVLIQRTYLAQINNNLERMERMIHQELSAYRNELMVYQQNVRDHLYGSISALSDSLQARIAEMSNFQQKQLDLILSQNTQLMNVIEARLDAIRHSTDDKINSLMTNNNEQLERIRATVEEKLQDTLEQRLSESFKAVSERLEMLHKGLGEMHSLAAGVGDLKRVLSNVKTRGIWGEIQLRNILEQILAPDQYYTNVVTKRGSNERVEFAIRLPGKDVKEQDVLLPIDAKFPLEDYHRMQEALEEGNHALAIEARKQLEARIRTEAKNILEKYIDPPNTTDFAIMFLPTESLYAEVLRSTGLVESLQRDFHVNLAGPSTMAAFLNSLSVGFRTLAISKRTSEVWKLLAAVKTDFSRFGDILDRTHKKLQEASNSIENAARKSRAIENKLKTVEQLDQDDQDVYLDY